MVWIGVKVLGVVLEVEVLHQGYWLGVLGYLILSSILDRYTAMLNQLKLIQVHGPADRPATTLKPDRKGKYARRPSKTE